MLRTGETAQGKTPQSVGMYEYAFYTLIPLPAAPITNARLIPRPSSEFPESRLPGLAQSRLRPPSSAFHSWQDSGTPRGFLAEVYDSSHQHTVKNLAPQHSGTTATTTAGTFFGKN